MKKKGKNLEKPNRRNFLKKSLLAGGGVVVWNGLKGATPVTIDIGEKINALTAEGKVVEIDKSKTNGHDDRSKENRVKARKGIPGRKFVMVIDLSRCKNAKRCQEGCRKMHNLPQDVNWLKVLKMQDSEDTAPYWMPSLCLHCDNPPCVKVCPVDATYKRSDGLVLIDNVRCIGCRFCMAACPYSARSFNWSKPKHSEELENTDYSPEKSIPRKIGTVEKCDFCADSLRNGELPHCVKSCPNGVYYMGDIYEDAVSNGAETVRFSELIREKAGYRLFEDLGTEPIVYYLPPANRLFPFKEDFENKDET